MGLVDVMLPLVILCIALICNTGCAGYSLPTMQVAPITQYTTRDTVDGLSVAIDPYVDKEKTKQFFGADLIEKGIVPIFVIIENNSPSTYLVEKSGFLVSSQEGGTSSAKSPAPELPMGPQAAVGITSGAFSVGQGVVALALPGTFLNPIPLIVVGAPIASYFENKNQAIARQLEVNELADKTLFSKESMHGFIYLSASSPVAFKATSNLHLLMIVKNVQKDTKLQFDFPLIKN